MGDKMADGTKLTLAPSQKQGRHPDKALSAAFVRSVQEPGKYFDGQGLFLKVDPSGARRWVQRIIIRGKRTELGLGSPPLVSLVEAREAALVNRKLARAGGDPLREKREAEAVLTFEEAAKKVHEIHLPSWRNKKHGQQFINTLATYAFPRMGKLKVADVTTADVLAVLTPIWLEKPETARRVRQRIGSVMKWAVAQGWRLVETTHELSPEISLVPTPGHTPGHVSVRIVSRGEEALITGDFLHHPCQMARPDWCSPADSDSAQALETRLAMFEKLADSPVLVIGTHFATPTAGHLVRDGEFYRLEV